MTYYTASFETVTLRFVLMMVVIVGAFIGGVPIFAILALPIFLSAMMAISFAVGNGKKISNMQVSKSMKTIDRIKAA